MIKNLPKHFFAWCKKYFSWNNHNKNFVMLSKNLLDSSKFFVTVRQAIFFWPRFDWLKTRGTFVEISNIKILKVSRNNFSVFLSKKWSLQLVYYDIITETCYVIGRRKSCDQQIIQTKLTSHVRTLPPPPLPSALPDKHSLLLKLVLFYSIFAQTSQKCPFWICQTLPQISRQYSGSAT